MRPTSGPGPERLPTAIVLGAAVWPGGPSPTLLRRTRHGAGLVLSGRAGRLVCTGGVGRHGPAEAAAAARIAAEMGVPSASVSTETASRTTWENLRGALPLLPGTSVLIVTDRWHMPRALMIARRLGLDAAGSPCPAGSRPAQRLRMAIREIPAYAKDRLRPL